MSRRVLTDPQHLGYRATPRRVFVAGPGAAPPLQARVLGPHPDDPVTIYGRDGVTEVATVLRGIPRELAAKMAAAPQLFDAVVQFLELSPGQRGREAFAALESAVSRAKRAPTTTGENE